MKCPVHLYIGQEAVATGICLNLQKDDYLGTNHRSHGHYLAKGGALDELLGELCGLSIGCSRGWGGSQHLYDADIGITGTSALVGAGISIGTGIGLALKMKRSKNISTIFFGDGATEEGYFYESLNFASLKQLPVIYVCENNFLATHSRIETRRPRHLDIYKIPKSMGIKSVKLDGNDTLAVFEAAKDIVRLVREQSIPYFIEVVTYRWKGHVSPDEDHGVRYRTKEEIEAWKKRCPIKKFVRIAVKNSLLTTDEIKSMKSDISSQVDSSFVKLQGILAQNAKAGLVPVTPY
jgi:pyruvate dehydrogenase E1 component alpha subunit